jgi:hypothetical protein
MIQMTDEAAVAEVGVDAELTHEHPVFGFMKSFADELEMPDAPMQDWEAGIQISRELDRPVDEFISWFKGTWPELEAGNTITDKDFRNEVEVINRNGKNVMRHKPTGMEVMYATDDNEFKARSRLRDSVLTQCKIWREAGSPIQDLDRYKEAVVENARDRLMRVPVEAKL